MSFRQAVISVRQPSGSLSKNVDERYLAPTTEILFRQPYHNLGLAMSFSFQKSFFSPFANCNLTIENNNNEIADAFKFDNMNYTKPRPLVEIRAGYSDVRLSSTFALGGAITAGLTRSGTLDTLKKSLPVVYAGHPNYLDDRKTRGGRRVAITLNDAGAFDLSGPSARITQRFPAGSTVNSILKALGDGGGFLTDTVTMGKAGALATKVDLWYNNRLILTDIIPELSKRFGFLYFKKGETYVFTSSGVAAQGALIDVNASTGLVEYPTKANWTHWNFQTLFAQPQYLLPGDWVKLSDPSFVRFGSSAQGYVTGVVTQGSYNFNDDEAGCQFTLAPEGYPVESTPMINI